MSLSKISLLVSACALVLAAVPSVNRAAAQTLPAVPEFIRSAEKLRAGVRCDQPPYGFRTEKGEFAGIEVEMARQIAAWAFGSPEKAELTCVTAENRIPQLLAKRVDLLIATLGVTPERARVIDFSNAYRWGGSGLLVRNDSPIRTLDGVQGRTVVMLKGTTQSAWFDANMPGLATLRLNTASDALQALLQGRADAYAHDTATLIVIAANTPGVRRIAELFAVTGGAVGLRKNEPDWLAWVNAALDRMKAENLFASWVVKWVPEESRPLYATVFEKPQTDGR